MKNSVVCEISAELIHVGFWSLSIWCSVTNRIINLFVVTDIVMTRKNDITVAITGNYARYSYFVFPVTNRTYSYSSKHQSSSLSRANMVTFMCKVDWLVDTTWYHVVSTNQSALRMAFTLVAKEAIRKCSYRGSAWFVTAFTVELPEN